MPSSLPRSSSAFCQCCRVLVFAVACLVIENRHGLHGALMWHAALVAAQSPGRDMRTFDPVHLSPAETAKLVELTESGGCNADELWYEPDRRLPEISNLCWPHTQRRESCESARAGTLPSST